MPAFTYKKLLTYQDMNNLLSLDLGGQTITPVGAVVGLNIDQNNDKEALTIDSESTTYAALQILSKYGLYVSQDISNGRGLLVTRNIAEAGSTSLAGIIDDNVANTQDALYVQQDGGGKAIHAKSTYDNVDVYALHAETNIPTSLSYVAWFHGDGDNASSWGISIWNGKDDDSLLTVHIFFGDGNGDNLGAISSLAGTVAYNAFTGGHPSIERHDKEHPFGYVMISSEMYHDLGYAKEHPGTKSHQPERIVEPSSKAYDKRVFGVYAGRYDKEKHQIYGLGDGYILVCDQGGNIEEGDFITSSDTEGHGMKQDDDLMHGYTIAKANEDVNWSKEPNKTKLIACTYHAS